MLILKHLTIGLFWIDADEILTPELKKEIEEIKKRPENELPDGFRFPRKTKYLGRWIKHSGWYPDYKMRLYRKEASFWDGVSPHETARVKGEVETLKGELLHYTKENISKHHQIQDSYSTLAAEYYFKNNKSVGGLGLFFYPISAFISCYILKQGFRDGIQGLIISMFNAYSVFLKYAKLWEHKNIQK